MNRIQAARDSTQRILDVAEDLFMDSGYNAVTLRDIAEALGIKQASLYYHFPGGKEQLFLAMTERMFERHRRGILTAVEQGGNELRAELRAVAAWFGSQRPLKLMRMLHADLTVLSQETREQLVQRAHAALLQPLRECFVKAQERGEIRAMHPDLLAGCFLWLMDGINYGESRKGAPCREAMVEEIISLLLDGLLPRTDATSMEQYQRSMSPALC